MEKHLTVLLCLCLFFAASLCYAQNFVVSDPKLALKDNIVSISYDILNSNRTDKFLVSMTITGPDGQIIHAGALSGDIGEGISGGSGKFIRWDLGADGIVMNSTIYVKINAKLIFPPNEEIPEMDEAAVEPDRSEESAGPGVRKEEIPVNTEPAIKEEEILSNTKTPSTVESKNFNRGYVILQSLALPGLGLARVTEKPHWIKGVAGYGCIAGSVLLNRKAINSYKGIYDLTGYNDKDELLQKSLKQDNISEILAYSAIGIWVADLIWTLIGTNDLKEKPFLGEIKGVTFETGLDPLMRAPYIGVGYRF